MGLISPICRIQGTFTTLSSKVKISDKQLLYSSKKAEAIETGNPLVDELVNRGTPDSISSSGSKKGSPVPFVSSSLPSSMISPTPSLGETKSASLAPSTIPSVSSSTARYVSSPSSMPLIKKKGSPVASNSPIPSSMVSPSMRPSTIYDKSMLSSMISPKTSTRSSPSSLISPSPSSLISPSPNSPSPSSVSPSSKVPSSKPSTPPSSKPSTSPSSTPSSPSPSSTPSSPSPVPSKKPSKSPSPKPSNSPSPLPPSPSPVPPPPGKKKEESTIPPHRRGQQRKKGDELQFLMRKSNMLARDRLISTTKVETFDEMVRGNGLTSGSIGENLFQKKPTPNMIVATAKKGDMISGKKSMGSMISTKTKGKK